MLCPFCREKDTSVVDSRPCEEGTAVRRRRLCTCHGGMRFTTFEKFRFKNVTELKVKEKENKLVGRKFTRS